MSQNTAGQIITWMKVSMNLAHKIFHEIILLFSPKLLKNGQERVYSKNAYFQLRKQLKENKCPFVSPI